MYVLFYNKKALKMMFTAIVLLVNKETRYMERNE